MRLITGIDLVEIERLREASERWGARFLQRIFTADELACSGGRPESLAARWAAKEATAKALGLGLCGLGAPAGAIPWRSVEIVKGERGEPLLRLSDVAATRAAELGITTFSISLTHSGGFAAAVVVGIAM
ncbi:MAG: holo-[acyl-carrier-protein] synthase [Herpetosiphonaceae bacterium]|nr:MAG: holo-[acyl-carrier-protein] synthase [Herpetosiphonaceae bacterium]